MQPDDKDWVFFTAVAEGDPIVICGLNVWDYKWIREGEKRIVITCPRYPDEIREPGIYTISNEKKTVRFAASEWTANVYGFCVPRKSLWQRIMGKFL